MSSYVAFSEPQIKSYKTVRTFVEIRINLEKQVGHLLWFIYLKTHYDYFQSFTILSLILQNRLR